MNAPCRLVSQWIKLNHYYPIILPKTVLFKNLNLKKIITQQNCQIRALHVAKYSPAGHSHWENIRHIKSAKDNERSKIFTQLSQQLEIAIRHGGSNDPTKNPKLLALVQQCKKQNMPKATLEKILSQSADCEEFLLSVSGPDGSAIIIVCRSSSLRDAKAHLSNSIRKSMFAGKLDFTLQAEFEKKRLIVTDIGSLDDKSVTDETATDIAIDVGAEDVDIRVNENGSLLEFTCGGKDYSEVEKAIESEEHGLTILASEFEYIPNAEIDLDESNRTSIQIFLKALMRTPEHGVAKRFHILNVFHNVNDFTTTFHT